MPVVERRATIAIIGNPNTGKTTLFNALTGLAHKVANYPGVTVEKRVGTLRLASGAADLVDLPGTYSLAARSPDELIAVDALLGKLDDSGPVDAIVAVVDASNLERNLYLVSQLLEFERPLVLALNMIDAADRRGLTIDVEHLAARLGVPVVPMRADRGLGIELLRQAIDRLLRDGTDRTPQSQVPLPAAFGAEVDAIRRFAGGALSRPEALRAIVDQGGAIETRVTAQFGAPLAERLRAAREIVGQSETPAALESAARYRWAQTVLDGLVRRPSIRLTTPSETIDSILTHRVAGTAILVLTLALVFQAIYKWSTPVMSMIDGGVGWFGTQVARGMSEGPLRSLIVDGLIGGVGGVVAFLPQILLLFFFLGILEDCGYMARAAFLMDRLLARIGLSGKSVIPLLSSFACAVPGIMSARVVEDRRDRIATILVAPLMSCSARLPVYVLLIGAFVPNREFVGGWIGLQGALLLAAHFIGAFVAIPVLWVVKRTLLRGPTPPFVMELPEYRLPNWRSIVDRLLTRIQAFVRRAGTVIISVAVLVWALSYFPHPPEIHAHFDQLRAAATSEPDRVRLDAEEAAAYLRQSLFGRMGHAFEPLVQPLGWDWRIGMAVAASFPAREVVIATMGTVFGIGSGVDENSRELADSLRSATWPDGRALFNLPVALSLIVFYALCCQCAATLVVMRRETGSWSWPALAFGYMTVLAWIGAFATYQLARVVGG